MENYSIIQAKNLSFEYPRRPLSLKDVNFEIKKNEKVLLLASEDMGKTTFLSLICGFETSYTGKLLFRNLEVRDMKDEDKSTSLIFSEPVFFENKTILENFNFMRSNSNMQKFSAEELSDYFKSFNFEIDVNLKIKKLNLIQKKELAFFRSLMRNTNLVLIDDQFEIKKNKNRIIKNNKKEKHNNLEKENRLDNKNNNENYLFDVKNKDIILNLYNLMLLDKEKTVVCAIGENTYKSCKNELKKMNFDRVFYLYDATLDVFQSIQEFETKLINFNQFLFCNKINYIKSDIFKDEEYYLDIYSEGYIIFNLELLGLELIKNVTALNLNNLEYETVNVVVKNDELFSRFQKRENITDNELMEAIEKKEIIIFSTLGGERLI